MSCLDEYIVNVRLYFFLVDITTVMQSKMRMAGGEWPAVVAGSGGQQRRRWWLAAATVVAGRSPAAVVGGERNTLVYFWNSLKMNYIVNSKITLELHYI